MSRVILLAADRPLPLLEPAFRRVRCTGKFTVETDGFSVRPHEYYQSVVDELGVELKPFRHELDLEATQEDVDALRAYLADHCRPGERIELWNVWVGVNREDRIPHFQGELADLALDTLEQLCSLPMERDCPGQCRLTVTI